jgi:glycosyltransferase involved in cell wall biosynthesis
VGIKEGQPRVREPIRVLYSFGLKLGGGSISTTAWYQVDGVARAGADVLVFPGILKWPLPAAVRVRPTLARGRLRISYKAIGRLRAYALHDYIVSRRIEKLAGQIDIVHTWPLCGLRTLRVAAKLGIPTVYERPNAHTRFAMERVQEECERLGVSLPRHHEHAYNHEVLRIEDDEYRLADYLVCPSNFVADTFLDAGFPPEKLVRHQYGFDEKVWYPSNQVRDAERGLKLLFAGGCAPRKGLHYALEAWLQSPACQDGTFVIAGAFVPGYAERLASLLAHPSVRVLGHRRDLPDLMRGSDILILPTIEEGSALVTYEARGSGCVLLVSEASGAVCEHLEDALIHRVGDVKTLTEQITLLHEDRGLLRRLRTASLSTAHEITWTAAGERLLRIYREVLAKACCKTHGSEPELTRSCTQGPWQI